MRLQEFADAEEQIKLWKLISDSVWHSIKQQAIEQEQKRATSQKKPSKKKPRPTSSKKPKTVNQPKLPNAQKSVSATKPTKQQQKQVPPQAAKPQVLPLVFKNSTRSNAATPQQQSSTSQSQTNANTLQQREKRQKHDPDSVANTQRQLDPLAFSDVVKRLTN
jgi:outer membrane biosynthesis protein TonB